MTYNRQNRPAKTCRDMQNWLTLSADSII